MTLSCPHEAASLAELAAQIPAATRVFHRLRLDFCCHGRRSLAEACAERGLDPSSVLAEIATPKPPSSSAESWDDKPLELLIAHVIEHFHVRARAELPELTRMALKVEQVHAEHALCPHGLAEFLTEFGEELALHMLKEERVLFPMMDQGRQNVSAPIHVMEAEHRDHALNLERLRSLASNYAAPSAACTTWRALYTRLHAFEQELMEHVFFENHVLFPRAIYG